MWISKKRWQALEKRIADLEKIIQSPLSLDEKEASGMINDFLQRRKCESIHGSVPKSS
ncbi:hypothetical protein KTH81_18785 [Lachnospiraceae bacterium ASD3451]|uniref:hypothetical protein n=1 Tax=Diplocloster agilis TaxID=2850323 RepID=UPI001D6C41A5|nr:hypothetical protein [Diplocloster agilis]MBU9745869.1 hypothetical protein [Diplocloster agilis]